MDASQWPQGNIGGVVRPVDQSSRAVDKKPRPQQGINCPRCNSTNTKFCYYNNYSLSQPRYFCKSCRRYWTEGGTLRSVPVGGGSRKKHRSSSSSSSSAKKLELTDLSPPQNPRIHDGQDLNLAYNPPIYNGISELVALPFALDHHTQNPNISSSTSNSCHLPFMELLKTAGNLSSSGLGTSCLDPISANPVSDSNSMIFPSTYPMHEYKPSLSFSVDGLENGYGNMQSNVQSSSRMGFPFEETSKPEFDQNRVDSNGYWNGMLSGGSW